MVAQPLDLSPMKLRTTDTTAPQSSHTASRRDRARQVLAEAEERRDKAYDSWQHLEAPEKGFYYRVYLANVGWVEDCRTAMGEAGRGL